MISSELARVLSDAHADYRVDSLSSQNCRQREIAKHLREIFSGNDSALQMVRSGLSIEGRPLSLVRFGTGPIRVLLWSQMHGDEPTATLAVMDMLSFFAGGGHTKVGMGYLGRRCSIYMIPILNPDGAERRMRHTAAGVDMNRDARRCATPEALFLRKAHRLILPSFGFNLHDQELSTVGDSSNITAIALLAPASDAERRISPSRKRAMQIASVIARSLETLAKGRIASYNDSFEPRAFGDRMQSWGTSTVLVESGHWMNDPGKKTIRHLNFVGLLSAIQSISSGSFRKAGLREYTRLSRNGKKAYDVIVRGAVVVHEQEYRIKTDIGIQLERTRGGLRLKVREVGDLRGFGSIFSINGKEAVFNTKAVRIDKTLPIKKFKGMLPTSLQG